MHGGWTLDTGVDKLNEEPVGITRVTGSMSFVEKEGHRDFRAFSPTLSIKFSRDL